MDNFMEYRKYSYLSEHFLNQSVNVLSQISGIRIWFTSERCLAMKNEFKNFVVVSTIRLKGEVIDNFAKFFLSYYTYLVTLLL